MGRLLADLGERAGSEPAREAPSEKDLSRGMDREEVLRIGVGRNHLRPFEPFLREPVDGVATASAASDDLDVGLEGGENGLELRVIVRRRGCLDGPLRLSGKVRQDLLG